MKYKNKIKQMKYMKIYKYKIPESNNKCTKMDMK